MSSYSAIAIMLLTNKLEQLPSGGREMLCKLNHDMLIDIYGDSLTVLEVNKKPVRDIISSITAFRGYIDGVNFMTINSVIRIILKKNIKKIFIDGSNFGEIARLIKIQYPNVLVYTFFHNVEVRFFLGSLRQKKSIHALAVLVANYLAEKKAVRYSDKIICLSNRDSLLLKHLYGRLATDISPMALQDKLSVKRVSLEYSKKDKYCLFVGGTFYANRDGITWFVRNVASHVSLNICIVGRGFEELKDELESEANVEVVGAVESLAEWYLGAHVVIAPIFDGSGMKTKVAEALMFGKKIIGTPEAFSGYEDCASKVGWSCSTAADFILAINEAQNMSISPFDERLRNIFTEKYSMHAATKRLAKILDDKEFSL